VNAGSTPVGSGLVGAGPIAVAAIVDVLFGSGPGALVGGSALVAVGVTVGKINALVGCGVTVASTSGADVASATRVAVAVGCFCDDGEVDVALGVRVGVGVEADVEVGVGEVLPGAHVAVRVAVLVATGVRVRVAVGVTVGVRVVVGVFVGVGVVARPAVTQSGP
jgi:hypothetical protein